MHAPKTQKQVRSYLGMVCYYNKFVKNFAEIARPLYDLVGKRSWTWGEEQQNSFEKLKEALTSAPILAYPSEKGRYILDTDASNFAVGAVLSQVQVDEAGNEEERVIAYYSKTLNQSEQRYCARRRELLAIVKAVKHFDVYVRGPEFTIRTDHASLQYLTSITDVADQMFRWILFLEQYSYAIEIRKGTDHANADTLSRMPCSGKICICDKVDKYERRNKVIVGEVVTQHTLPQTKVNAIRFMPRWSPELISKFQQEDHDLKELYKAKKESEERPKYNTYSGESPTCKAYFAEWKRIVLWKDVLYRRWESNDGSETRLQMIVPRALQKKICEEVHDGRYACHMGKKRTLRLINKAFYWYKQDKDVSWWIRTCDKCQRRNRPFRTPKAPLTPYKSGFPNERIAMDVMGPFKDSNAGNKYVLCITDHFSKYARAIPMPDQKAERIARILVQDWVYVWGEPNKVHTDQGSNFESGLMKDICEHLEVEKTRTTPYHPQGNAQVERYNQTIMSICSKLTDKENYQNWDEKLPISVAAYNATEHDTTGKTPNRLMMGREVSHNFDKMLPKSQDPDKLETWDDYVQAVDEDTREAFQAAREATGRAVLIYKKHYDSSSHLNKHQVGDTIMLRDFRHLEKGTKKMADPYDGPYYVLDVLSDVNFRIAKSEQHDPRIVHHDRM